MLSEQGPLYVDDIEYGAEDDCEFQKKSVLGVNWRMSLEVV